MMAGFSKRSVALEAFSNGHSHTKMLKSEWPFYEV